MLVVFVDANNDDDAEQYRHFLLQTPVYDVES